MRLVLDLHELAQILTRCFGVTITSDGVTLNPAEGTITISDATLDMLASSTSNSKNTMEVRDVDPPRRPWQAPATYGQPPVIPPDDDDTGGVELSEEDLQQLNAAAMNQRNVLKDPDVQRFLLGTNETVERPY